MKIKRILIVLFVSIISLSTIQYQYLKIQNIDKENKTLIIEIKNLKTQNDRLENLIKQIFGSNLNDRPIFCTEVIATAYSARKEECDINPEITANGTPSRVGSIAVSRDLENKFGLNLGDLVILENMGLFKVEDRMNKKWEKRIDILHGNSKAAKLFGKKKIKLTWLGKE